MNYSILLCSDVVRAKCQVDLEYLSGLIVVEEGKLFKFLSGLELSTLRTSLEQSLSMEISDVDLDLNRKGVYGKYVFENIEIKLNLRVDAHLRIAVLISVYDYLNRIIQLHGRLYILNRTYLMKNATEEIFIAINKLGGASLLEIKSAIEKLSLDYPGLLSIGESEIYRSIEFFKQEGLLVELRAGEYALTPLGLIFAN
ncbi:hypothetical protein SAMN05660461_0220 [Chitinophaga ginsengisegetis]|uniref:Uncharacterized protein n=1 Tax=Chitinophaga ginsengisegetis TaxID=393003 RepID=A0A1T5N4G9_9BACT|nr:hypothetical protein [Chitinophaga ginsengisegetis]SKC95079.1 hypothetical protein SAMN05660461_0220 [Chitinophaga ginsengisegetis]